MVSAAVPGPQPDYAPVAQEMLKEEDRFHQPVAQGLIDAGAVPEPAGTSWFHDGVIRLNEDNRAAFEVWWRSQVRGVTGFASDAQDGYRQGAQHPPA